MCPKVSSEAVVREIKRKTRRKFSSEEKIRIVLDGLRGEESIAEICRREGIVPNLYYHWSKIAKQATEYRKKVHKRWRENPQEKANCFERFINSDWNKLLKDLNDEELDSELDKMLEN